MIQSGSHDIGVTLSVPIIFFFVSYQNIYTILDMAYFNLATEPAIWFTSILLLLEYQFGFDAFPNKIYIRNNLKLHKVVFTKSKRASLTSANFYFLRYENRCKVSHHLMSSIPPYLHRTVFQGLQRGATCLVQDL